MNIYLYIPHIIHPKLVEFLDFVGYSLDWFFSVFTSIGEHTNVIIGGVWGKVVLDFSTFRCHISKVLDNHYITEEFPL